MAGFIANVLQLAKKDFGTTTANAQLIAAAPDLLEALESGRMACEHCIGNPMVKSHSRGCTLQRAAIAKAKGELP